MITIKGNGFGISKKIGDNIFQTYNNTKRRGSIRIHYPIAYYLKIYYFTYIIIRGQKQTNQMRGFKNFLSQTRFTFVICVFLFFACAQKNTDSPVAADKSNSFKLPDIIPVKDPILVKLDTCPTPLTVIIPEKKADSFVLKTKDFTKVIHSPKVIPANLYVPLKTYKTSDGLPLNTVLSSFVDSKGNLWIGTGGSGVSRYDGKSFMTYSVSHGLPANNIYDILEDTKGNIWFATFSGISRYNGKSFTNYSTDQGLSNNSISSILQDKNGTIWVGTRNGLSKLPYGTTDFTNYSIADGLSSNNISCLFEDKYGAIWIGTSGGGLNRYDGKTFINYTTAQGLADNIVSSIAEDKNQNLCIGTQKGISFYNGKSFTNYTTTQGLAGNDVTSILKDKNGNLWFGTATGASLYNDNPLSDNTPIFTNYTTLNGLPNNRITSMAEDKSNNIWFTSTNGVFRLDRDWRFLPGHKASLSSYLLANDVVNNSVTSFLEDSKKNLWFGTLGAGVYRLSKDEKTFTTYTTAQGLPNDDVRNIVEDRKGNLWFVTTKGIARLDKEWKTFTTYTTKQGLANEIGTSMVEDSSGNLWFGTRGGGVSMLDKEWKTFTSYTTMQGLAHNIVRNLMEDKKGNLWFGTLGGGLSRLDKGHKYFTNYTTNNGLITDYVWNVFVDNNENIWLATEVGLIRFDGNTFSTYTTNQGLGDNGIGDILLNKNGRLWIATNSGISVLKGFDHIAKKEDSDSYLPASNPLSNLELSSSYNPDFEKYNVKTGYPINDINMNGMFMTKDRIIWAGTSDKLVRVDYNSLYKNPDPPNVVIQGLKINNESISWYDLKEDNENTDSLSSSPNITEEIHVFGKVLDEVVRNDMRRKFRTIEFDSITAFFPLPIHLVLPYQYNTLTFDFAAIEPAKPQLVKYQYMLEGYNTDWNPTTSQTRATFGNIFEGSYTFKLKAQSPDGVWSEPILYTFKLLPPWHRTWWAYAGYVLLAMVLLWLFAQWRSRQLRHKNLALETLIGERTEEIRKKNELLGHQTEKLKEMDTMKTHFFANISHEFRTPLTLIKGPIEKLEEEHQNNISTPNIKMIRRNANRLLNLVNQLLDLSKLDSGKLQLDLAEGDVFKCLRAAASAFSSQAASRNMDYQIKISSISLWAAFDRDKLEKIVYNLLGNSFKFTEDGDKVHISANHSGGRLQLVVSDSGQGIEKDKLPHIFDRFFQVDDSYTKQKSGSGIGLALTKELVGLMNGEIYVESEPEKGSIFKVMLPLEEIKSHKTEKRTVSPALAYYAEDEETKEPVTESKEVKLLIIEDNNDMRHFIKEQLEQDYQVLEAVNGKDGLQKANELVPDLIITDLMMPQMDGITLCKNLKTSIGTSHIPVIMLTARAGIENKLEGLETGADDYLTKPFSAKELQVRVKNLIEQRQQLRELYSRGISLDPKEITVTSLDERFLMEVLALLEENYNDPDFGVPEMQKGIGMSKTQLHLKLKALTDHPPGELLRNFRLKRASQLLSQTGENISQIAYAVGFNTLPYFTKCFKELYGITPSAFIQKSKSGS